MRKVAILNFGLGNIRSIYNALIVSGTEPIVCEKNHQIADFDFLILPGVGAFPVGMELLKKSGFDDSIREHVSKEKKLLGICLGMQMLFDSSTEHTLTKGLGIVKGQVVKINESKLYQKKLPHISWKTISYQSDTQISKMFDGIGDKDKFYFVHSFSAVGLAENLSRASCQYGDNDITAGFVENNTWGVQFHPEKSRQNGIRLLKNFLEIR